MWLCPTRPRIRSADRDQPEATDFDQQLREAIDIANVPTLLLVLVQLTRTERWLDGRTGRCAAAVSTTTTPAVFPPKSRTGSATVHPTRSSAWHRGGDPRSRNRPPELLVEMMTASEGAPLPEKYAGIMTARLKSFSDPTPPHWTDSSQRVSPR